MRANLLRLGAAFGALVAAALIMLVLGYNPIQVFTEIIKGSTGTVYRLKETVNKAIPLIVLSLGIAVAFKMKFWNIGAEGQFYMGAFAASFVALYFPNLPMVVMLPAMFTAGLIGGGLWALVPAALKAKFGASETLTTLMMNYVAQKWVSYLQYGPWKDPTANGFPRVIRFRESAILPKVFGLHSGWIITILLVIVVFILMKYTKLGYEISVLGENVNTARYAGMNVNKTMIIAVLISGGLCGAAGMIQASAIERSLSDQLSGGLGFTAIITTWLARLNPPAIVVVSFLFAMLLQGGAYLQSAMQIPSSVSEILQGIILFFVLGSEFFIQYKIVRKKREAVGQLAKEA